MGCRGEKEVVASPNMTLSPTRWLLLNPGGPSRLTDSGTYSRMDTDSLSFSRIFAWLYIVCIDLPHPVF